MPTTTLEGPGAAINSGAAEFRGGMPQIETSIPTVDISPAASMATNLEQQAGVDTNATIQQVASIDTATPGSMLHPVGLEAIPPTTPPTLEGSVNAQINAGVDASLNGTAAAGNADIVKDVVANHATTKTPDAPPDLTTLSIFNHF